MPTTLEDARTIEDLLQELGDISPRRVRLKPPPGTAEEADVLRLRHADPERRLFELVDGTLVEKAMGFRESLVAAELIRILGEFVRRHQLGVVVGEGGMMRLAKGLVRIPDVAFLSWKQFPERRIPSQPVPALFPDLAVEVVSLGNTRAEMQRKSREYFAAGTRLVWIIDPHRQTAEIRQSDGSEYEISTSAMLDGADVLPGFRVSLADLFQNLPVDDAVRQTPDSPDLDIDRE